MNCWRRRIYLVYCRRGTDQASLLDRDYTSRLPWGTVRVAVGTAAVPASTIYLAVTVILKSVVSCIPRYSDKHKSPRRITYPRTNGVSVSKHQPLGHKCRIPYSVWERDVSIAHYTCLPFIVKSQPPFGQRLSPALYIWLKHLLY